MPGSDIEAVEYTDAQREQIRRDYAARRQRQMIVFVLMLLAILALFLKRRLEELIGVRLDHLTTVAFGLILFRIAFAWWNWRCPGCKQYLGRGFNPKFCQRCGVQLHD